ncbi:MAG: cell division protein FtsQ/DivIB [Oscillospiraceae bacterium]
MRDVVKSGGGAKKRKNANNSAYYGIIAFVVIVTFVILSTTVFFRIDTLVITGSSIYSVEEITSASQIKGGDNLIRTFMGKCGDRIEQQLVYVETAEPKRHFPSTVEIYIEPSVESANIVVGSTYYIVSQSGKILEITDAPRGDILTVIGAVPLGGVMVGEKFVCEDEKHTEVLYKLMEVGNTALDNKITAFDMTDYLNVSCNYDNRITIELGATSELDYKMKLADMIISDKIGPETEGTLKMLSNGASFIDKTGLEQNEQTYLENIGTLTSADEAETEGEEDNDKIVTNSEGSTEEHFE